jgi:hypothetical protein
MAIELGPADLGEAAAVLRRMVDEVPDDLDAHAKFLARTLIAVDELVAGELRAGRSLREAGFPATAGVLGL